MFTSIRSWVAWLLEWLHALFNTQYQQPKGEPVMSALSIQVPFPVFQDRDGQPLDNGYVWIGKPNLNPQTNPVVAYFDKDLTIPAAQPLRTINGCVSNAGTPAQIYVDGVNFSILVQDRKGTMVYNFPLGSGVDPSASGVLFTGFKGQSGFVSDLAGYDGSDWIGFQQAGTGTGTRSGQDKMRETVSVKDFGAVGDGVANDTAAIQLVLNHGGNIFFPAGTYKTSGRLDVLTNTNLIFDAGVTISVASGILAFNLTNTQNVSIYGNGATIQSVKPPSSPNAHCIYMNGATNVVIRDLIIDTFGGDGFYIGGISTDSPCGNIFVDNVRVNNAGRNGMSVTYADVVDVQNSSFNNSDGNLPKAGVDVEPNAGTYTKRISFSNCSFVGNAGSGFITQALTAGAISEDVRIHNCYSSGNGGSGVAAIAAAANGTVKNVLVSNSTITGNTAAGVYSDYGTQISVVNNTVTSNLGAGAHGIYFGNSKNVVAENNYVGLNAQWGIAVTASTNQFSLIGNTVEANNSAGIMLRSGATNGLITGNRILANGVTDTAGSKFNFSSAGAVTDITITNNRVRKASAINANVSNYGLYVYSNIINSLILGNDCYLGGSSTGIYVAAGVGNVNGGNRNNDGTYTTTAN